jgi:hypothetical protein
MSADGDFAACLGHVLGLPASAVPGDPAAARPWLAERGLGLVPVADPAAFHWGGPWIAELPGETVVAFGSPPGIVLRPSGGDAPLAAVERGHLVAPLDAGLWRPAGPELPLRAAGVVELIAVAPAAEAPMVVVERAEAVAGAGLRGDRYLTRDGSFDGPVGHDLTLVEAERLEGLLAPADARRNVVTRGIDLNALVGRRFAVGDVECVGRRLCEPCALLERLTAPGVLRALVHQGGLRADILRGGSIAPGDAVRAID